MLNTVAYRTDYKLQLQQKNFIAKGNDVSGWLIADRWNFPGRHDTEHKDTRQNDTQHNCIKM